jgi:hypothetical protein
MTRTRKHEQPSPMTPTEAFRAARQYYVGQVLALLVAKPERPYREIAEQTRVCLRTVVRIAVDSGITRKRGPKPGRIS